MAEGARPTEPRRRRGWPARPRLQAAVTVAVILVGWLAVALPTAAVVFLKSSRTTVLASHNAVIRPTLDGWAQVNLGPFLPSFRYPTGSPVGARIGLGKTTVTSYDELVRRYAFLAVHPDSQVDKVRDAVGEMAVDAVLVGALAGLVAPGLWCLVGARRRQELLRSARSSPPRVVAAALLVGVVIAVVTRPWERDAPPVVATTWQPISAALPDVPVPPEATPLQVDAGLLTQGTKRLVESALDSYRKSSTFYREAADAVPDAVAGRLHLPSGEESVAVLVSDRHDNIGMDEVARAVADAGGATWLIDAGDDTSTGSSWEAFSLESLDAAFDDYPDRFLVAGNHDHGSFLTGQADQLGFTVLDGEVVDGPDGVRLLGVSDPRSSGLGNWRDETGLTFDEVTSRIADAACTADEDGSRVSTLVVHDANNGAEALQRGCVDLVVAGHLHVVVGPERVTGTDGRVGYAYTTGTTGGAAYAIAIGTKPRRDATVSLVTYRSGHPAGVQAVSLSPLGTWTVGPYTELPGTSG